MEQQMMNGCALRAYRVEATTLADISGILKLQNCEAVKHQVLALLRGDIQVFYLHVGQLLEIDSAGLGVLVGLHMTARKNKIDFHLLSPTMMQMRLLEATRLNSVLSILSGVQAEEARSRLAREENAIELPALPAA